MGRQSTRHRYRTRREKNQRVKRIVKLVAAALLLVFLLLLVANGEEWWDRWKYYFY